MHCLAGKVILINSGPMRGDWRSAAAETLSEFNGKQHFLNTVYEPFFQGYSVKVADTHGIVCTAQEVLIGKPRDS